MKRIPDLALSIALVCAAAGIAAVLPTPASAQPAATTPVARPADIPMRDFFRNVKRGYFRLSDDGRWLGFMEPAAAQPGAAPRMNVFVQRLDGSRLVGEPRRITAETARDISTYRWKGSSTVLFEKDFGGDENFHVVAVDATTGQLRDLTPWEGVRASLVDDLEDDPLHVLVSHNRRDRKAFDVVRMNVRTGEETLVAENPGNVVGWTSDHAGSLRIGVASDGVNNTLLFRAADGEPFKPIIRTDFRTSVQPQFFDPQNRRFYANSNRGRDRQALVLIDPARPDEETVVFEHPLVDNYAAGYSRRTKALTMSAFQVERIEYRFFDEPTKQLYTRLQERLPGMEITLQSQTRDEDKFVVAANSDRSAGVRYLYDRKTDALTLLGELSPWLPQQLMAPMRPVTYSARDGLQIPAYLTLPVDRPAKNLACIVNPHGGPWVRDSWAFNPEVQFLASRGYCVLQMNYRGSTGYGRRFWEASFGQWGLKMQDDVTDGAKWLVDQGIADPKRLGIYGGSYGGYATLAGITFTPDLYAAAVDYVGVSNLFTFMKTIPPYWEAFRDQMYAMVGNPDNEADKARLTATSPVFHVDRIRTPLFVAQGARDPRVNKAESDQIVEALKKRGVEVEYLVKDNEGHGFANEENRFEFYGAMERFFGRHLKP